MKAFATAALILAAPALLHATVWTVSNVPTSPGQYTTVQEAIDAASAGDTIYVTGSATTYSGTTYVRKRLTIIGPGYSPLPARISAMYMDTIASISGSSGSKLIGLRIDDLRGYTNSFVPTNVTVERSYLGGLVFSGGSTGAHRSWSISSCYMASGGSHNFGGSTLLNVNITNCIISGSMSNVSPNSSVLITNNIFLGTGTQTAFQNVQNAVISNNIFWGRTPVGTGVENCAFNNNITYQTPNNTIPFGSNVGSGNLIGVNPQFTNAPDQSINFTYDYRLQVGSPGVGAGTDGTDIGIYGGPFPMPNMTGAPRIPSVTEFTLQNTTIAEGGSLNVQVKARKND